MEPIGSRTTPRIGKHPLPSSPHPAWLEAMIRELQPEWDRACWPSLFVRTARGELPPIGAWRKVLADFFLIVESFPKYLALSLTKATYGKRQGDARVRRWLLSNLAIEARHAEWYVDWVEAIGLEAQDVFGATPCEEVRALHDHLWTTCQRGSLAEGVAAANWAIEGVTGIWSRAVAEPFRGYTRDGFDVNSASMMWLNAHARYDDAHPDEALEVLKLYVDAPGGRRGDPAVVKAVSRRALELFAAAIDACEHLGSQ